MTQQLVFAVLCLLAAGTFAALLIGRFSLVAMGAAEDRFDHPGWRTREMLLFAFGQKRVLAKPFGLNHFVLFWSFLVLLIANGAFVVSGLLPGVSLRLLPSVVRGPLLLAFDVVSILALAAVCIAAVRRLFFKLDTPYVKRRSVEAFLILGFIGTLMIAYVGLHATEIARGAEPLSSWMPVSSLVARLFDAASATTAMSWFWWLHAIALLAFLVYLPVSKHMHIITAIPNVFFASRSKPNTVPREDFAIGNSYGAATVTDFTWKDLLDSFSCTECGRCQAACPAVATNKQLNPRQVVHTLKVNLLHNASELRAGRPPTMPLIGPEAEGTNDPEALWACTTCGACTEACPVLIEHPSKIVKMRRHLVEMESRFPPELLNLFENMEQRSNPWGIAPTERTKWQSTMAVKPFVAGETEYLVFVGCAGAFDARQKQVTVALATILDAAGVSWGTLGRDEKCCGDSVRRLGNEYLFDRMARENVDTLRSRGVTKVITACPHCFSTLKNDYRQFGLEVEVVHHTEVLERLLREGRIRPNRQVTELGKVLYHDSCYLGRHNGIFDQPRAAISAVTGSQPVEAPRNRENAFCCGAGGGRMWMEETGAERINAARAAEAIDALRSASAAAATATVCVACPYCLVMFEDGLKGREDSGVRVRDLAEIVAEGLRPIEASDSPR